MLNQILFTRCFLWLLTVSLSLALIAGCGQAAPEVAAPAGPAQVETAAPAEVAETPAAAAEPPAEATEEQPAETEPAADAEVAEAAGDRPNIPVLRLQGRDFGYPSPFGYVRGPGYIYSSFIFDNLVWKDAEGNPIPWLAESWSVSDDNLIWTFTLREGVAWHDGEPLTAEDVVFSFEYAAEHPTGLPVQALVELAGIEATGEREVTLTLDKPYAPLLTNLVGSQPIMPKHVWEGVEDPKAYREADSVVGTGPYKLIEYNQADGSYLYEANEEFFLGPPAVNRIEFLPVNDPLLGLAQNQLDAAGPDVQASVPEEIVAQFTQDPFQALTGPGEWAMVLKFNMTKAPFDDVKFRQAVAYAIDQADMVERLLLGQGEVGNLGWLSPASPWYNPEVAAYARDLEQANALLDELELADSDGDGVRELPDGTPLSYELPFAAPGDSPRNAELLQAYLADVGIEVEPVAVDRAARDQRASEGDYDLILVGHGGLGGDPDFMRTTFHSQSKSTSFARPHGFASDEFDQLAGQQLRQMDPAARQETVNQMQAIIAEQLPVIPLYHPTRYWFYNPEVLTGWHFTPGGLASGIPLTLDKYLFVAGEAVVGE